MARSLRGGLLTLRLLDDPSGLLDLGREGGAHLVQEVEKLQLVQADLVGERHGLGVVDSVIQLVDQLQEVHGASLRRDRVEV